MRTHAGVRSWIVLLLACEPEPSPLPCRVWGCPDPVCTVSLTLSMPDIRGCFPSSDDLPDVLASCADAWNQPTCEPTLDEEFEGSEYPVIVEAFTRHQAAGICGTGSKWSTALGTRSVYEWLDEIALLCDVEQLAPPLETCRPVGDPKVLAECVRPCPR